jgi:predicted transposase/invertase (TIGR01784 family)
MMRPLVSFDWAIKRLLRQKANFDILEGFLSVLLKDNITIHSIGESESNAHHELSKINKVDILCETIDKKIILIELQYNSENDYFQRMLFVTSKAITDRMLEGHSYDKVSKVISINIVYFDLGQGEDYVYYGSTEFRGIHMNDDLRLSAHQQKLYNIHKPSEIFAEYYIIKVNSFNDIAKDGLDEWIFYFKNNALPTTYSAPGLESVSKNLKYDDMSPQSKIDYDAHQKEMAITYGVIETAKYEGREEGREETIKLIVVKTFKNGLAISLISSITGLSEDKINVILKSEDLI